jgi:hypothetical protein
MKYYVYVMDAPGDLCKLPGWYTNLTRCIRDHLAHGRTQFHIPFSMLSPFDDVVASGSNDGEMCIIYLERDGTSFPLEFSPYACAVSVVPTTEHDKKEEFIGAVLLRFVLVMWGWILFAWLYSTFSGRSTSASSVDL